MKILRSFLLVVVLVVMAPLAQAQSKLSPEYMRMIYAASNLFTQERYDEALEQLDAADNIHIDTPIALNMRGAVYTEMEDFDKATEAFNKALKLEPNYFAPKFNLGEIMFLKKNYQGAVEHFNGMTETYENNELLQFKLMLTYLMLDDMESAAQWRDAIKFPSDTPAYYFANAAYNFKQGKEGEAKEFINSSQRIFPPASNLIFLQSLGDLGWVNPDDYISRDQMSDIQSGVSSSTRKGGSVSGNAGGN